MADRESKLPRPEEQTVKIGGMTLPLRITPVTLSFMIYLLLLLARLIDASVLTRENEYFAVIVLQMTIFLIPGFAYLLWRGDALRPRLRMRPPRLHHLVLMLGALLMLAGGSMLLQMIFGGLQSSGQSFSLYDTFVSKPGGSAGNALYLIVAYAALPAFCEELVFRGIFCAEYEREGAICASLMSMTFFTMLHFDLRGIPVYLFAGLCLSAVVYATRSLIAGMLVHFAYNLFCLFGIPYVTAFYASSGGLWVLFFVIVVLLLFGALLFCGEAARLYRGYATHAMRDGANVALTSRQSARRFLLRLLTPGVGVCFLLYLIISILGLIF